jgi:predicted small secreted protein
MRKILAFVAVAVVSVSLAGCGSKNDGASIKIEGAGKDIKIDANKDKVEIKTK